MYILFFPLKSQDRTIRFVITNPSNVTHTCTRFSWAVEWQSSAFHTNFIRIERFSQIYLLFFTEDLKKKERKKTPSCTDGWRFLTCSALCTVTTGPPAALHCPDRCSQKHLGKLFAQGLCAGDKR